MPSSDSLHDKNVVVAQRVANRLFEGVSALHSANEFTTGWALLAVADKKNWCVVLGNMS